MITIPLLYLSIAAALLLALVGLIALLTTISVSLHHDCRSAQVENLTLHGMNNRLSWELEIALHQLERVRREHGASVVPFCPRPAGSVGHG